MACCMLANRPLPETMMIYPQTDPFCEIYSLGHCGIKTKQVSRNFLNVGADNGLMAIESMFTFLH